MKVIVALIIIYIISMIFNKSEEEQEEEYYTINVSQSEKKENDRKAREIELSNRILFIESSPNNPNYYKLEDWRKELKELK